MFQLLFVICILLQLQLVNAAEKYIFDQSHTSILWHVNHFGFSTQTGKFSNISGSIIIDEKHPENSSVEATIDISSLITGVPALDKHLSGEDFFDISKFPTAVFISESVKKTGKHTAKIHGTLTLHGVSKQIDLMATLNKIDINPFSKRKVSGFSATTKINRSDFDIKYGIPNVSDEVILEIAAEAILEEDGKW